MAGTSAISADTTAATPQVNSSVAESRPIMPAPTRARPSAPGMRRAPGAIGARKNTSASGSNIDAASSNMRRHDNAERRSETGKHQALDDELTRDLRAARANRRSHGHFPPLAQRFGDQEIRQIHARDQQHQSDGAEQTPAPHDADHRRRATNTAMPPSRSTTCRRTR